MFPFLVLICNLMIYSLAASNKCYLVNSTIFCYQITPNIISDSIDAEITKDDVRYLNITDSFINLVQRKSFANYKKLKTLVITRSQLMFIEHDAFVEHPYLEILDLSDNFLRRFNSRIFRPNNKVTTLRLSNNLLEDLNNFDLDYMTELTTLDLSSNLLQYLPKVFVKKILNDSNLVVLIDKNPFDCSLLEWKNYLSEAFCNSSNKGNQAKLKMQPVVVPIVQENNNETISKEICIKNCHFLNCVIWTISGVWIGIIIGNICKIKDLIFIKPKKMDNKCTQYDVIKFRNENPLVVIEPDFNTEGKPETEEVENLPRGKKAVNFKTEDQMVKESE